MVAGPPGNCFSGSSLVSRVGESLLCGLARHSVGYKFIYNLSANEVSLLQKSHLGEQLSSPLLEQFPTLSFFLPLPGTSDRLPLF